MDVVSAVPSDRRGWILSIISALACVFGGCIICVDVFVRMLPGHKDFRIQDSNAFLAGSMSLSFGVMIFSALFSMLPSARHNLVSDGLAKRTAGLLMMTAFVVGFLGIQVVSRFLHRFMPSHVVDCDHAHDAAVEGAADSQVHASRSASRHRSSHRRPSTGADATEATPLLVSPGGPPLPPAPLPHHPSMREVRNGLVSFVKDTKANCDEFGPCYGYSEPCGQECKRPLRPRPLSDGNGGGSQHADGDASAPERDPPPLSVAGDAVHEQDHHLDHLDHPDHLDHLDHLDRVDSEALTMAHHHHVPTNSFLSIGVQTVLAIGLHKFPEGFITFATNHANPSLGFTVFLALLVHNVAEGFAMALPLYMALGSRVRAILWAAALGGLSQPLGAGTAALWLHYLSRGRDSGAHGTAYGLLFAVTSGIMVAVALQLFVEGITLHHDRQLCIIWAFVGMMLLGLSSALVK